MTESSFAFADDLRRVTDAALSSQAPPTGLAAPGSRLHSRRPPGGVDLVRVADCTLAVLLLAFLAPLLVVVALAIKLQDRGSVFFSHRRIGRDGRSFGCLKFRTMVTDAEARLHALLASDADARAEWALDHKLRRDPRITALGVFLRKSSLDELPQLFNVLRGEMSLVGPRPIVEAEVPRYGRRFADYCRVRPGVTGLWQIGGRNDVSYRRRVACDVVFVRSQSLALYLTILVRTVPAVLMRSGSY